MADMLQIVTKQEQDGKKQFEIELRKHKEMIDRYLDQSSSNPSWIPIEESFLELKEVFITWQVSKAILNIYREES